MKKFNINTKGILKTTAFLLVGVLLGWLIFGGSRTETVEEHAGHADDATETIWTCSMHPQIRQTEPGKCPICGMDLIPLSGDNGATDEENVLQMTKAAAKMTQVQTSKVTFADAEKELLLTGKIGVDERRIAFIPAHFAGRIEKLYVNFTGEQVKKGQTLAAIYSPALITAQRELLQALKYRDTNPDLYKAARNKLRNWKITESQINRIVARQEIITEFPVVSHVSGVVLERNVSLGDHVEMGSVMFKLADLSKVWALFEAYESDLPWINKGDVINFTVPSVPGKTFTAKITFIDPVLNPQTRTSSVRAEINNPEGLLKPEMFLNGVVKAELSKKDKRLVVPKSAVMWTGKRSVVYVTHPENDVPTFEFRKVVLGPALGETYVIEEGLREGEEVVTHGTFAIDAAAQLQGKHSMMSPEGGAPPTMPGMDMEAGPEQTPTSEYLEGEVDFSDQVPPAFRKQLDQVIDEYLGLKEGLVKSDVKETDKYSAALLSALEKLDGSVLKGDAKAFWEEKKSFIIEHTKLCREAKTMEGKRENFIYLSQPLVKVVKAFGATQKLYVNFCPMADDGKGAYWLSETKEIRNPFMPAMLTCGEVRDTIK